MVSYNICYPNLGSAYNHKGKTLATALVTRVVTGSAVPYRNNWQLTATAAHVYCRR